MKLRIALILGLLLCSASRADVTAWIYGGPGLIQQQDSDIEDVTFRAGWIEGDIEVGLSSSFYSMEQRPHIFGAYTFYNFSPIMWSNPIDVDWLPGEVEAIPYLGGVASIDVISPDGRYIGPVAGLKVQESIFIEFQYINTGGELPSGDEFRAVFGLNHRF